MLNSEIDYIHVRSSEEYRLAKDLLWKYFLLRQFDKALGKYQHEYDNISKKYGPPNGALVLARMNQFGIGMVAYQSLEYKVCEMKRMFVMPKYQRLGIGELLCKRIILLAQHAGYELMRLDTHMSMMAAHKLYEKIGFYQIERYNDNPLKTIRFYELELKPF